MGGETDVLFTVCHANLVGPFNKLIQYHLIPMTLSKAISTQNTQVTAGAIGDLPVVDDNISNAKVTSRLAD